MPATTQKLGCSVLRSVARQLLGWSPCGECPDVTPFLGDGIFRAVSHLLVRGGASEKVMSTPALQKRFLLPWQGTPKECARAPLPDCPCDFHLEARTGPFTENCVSSGIEAVSTLNLDLEEADQMLQEWSWQRLHQRCLLQDPCDPHCVQSPH